MAYKYAAVTDSYVSGPEQAAGWKSVKVATVIIEGIPRTIRMDGALSEQDISDLVEKFATSYQAANPLKTSALKAG